MLGKNHAMVGAAVWLGGVAVTKTSYPETFDQIFPALSEGHGPESLFLLALSTIVASGAAVLPDLDEPEATAARSLGVAGKVASKTLRKAAGGHRQRTHTLVFAGVMGFLAWFVSRFWEAAALWKSLPAAVMVGICTLWGLLLIGRAVEDKGVSKVLSTPVAWILSIGSGGIMVLAAWIAPDSWLGENIMYVFDPRWWLPAALAVGVVAHLLGDLPTKSGVPVLWPLTKARFAFKIMKVGGKGEARAALLVFIAVIIFGVMAVQALWP